MIAAILQNASVQIRYYLNNPESLYDRADPTLARCLVGLWDCLANLQPPTETDLTPAAVAAELSRWRNYNARQLAQGRPPYEFGEYRVYFGCDDPEATLTW